MATFNKAALAERIYEFDNFSTKKQATEFVEDILRLIKDEVAEGNEVSLAGFGKFEQYKLASGVIKPKFSAFTDFKNAVNG